MTIQIDLQIACDDPLPEPEDSLTTWAKAALHELNKSGELTLRLVSTDEIQALNKTYRQQDKPTNVLAFPANLPPGIDYDLQLLGDVIICPAVLKSESQSLNRNLSAHWAHIIVHGVLHLLGYDHIHEKDAEVMQPLESNIVQKLGFENPYMNEELDDK